VVFVSKIFYMCSPDSKQFYLNYCAGLVVLDPIGEDIYFFEPCIKHKNATIFSINMILGFYERWKGVPEIINSLRVFNMPIELFIQQLK